MNDLLEQPTALPTRKLGAASALTGLVLALAEAIFGLLPGGGEELRSALTVLIDSLVAGVIGGAVPMLGGYFVRDKAPVK